MNNTTHANHVTIDSFGELRTQYGERLFIGPFQESWYGEMAPYNPDYPERRPMVCSYCGVRPTLKIASGTPECSRCWNWRKLDGPAALHWLKVSTQFVSNIDMYDYNTFFPKTLEFPEDADSEDLTMRDIVTTLKTAQELQKRTFALVEEHSSTQYAKHVCDEALKPFGMQLACHPVTEKPFKD